MKKVSKILFLVGGIDSLVSSIALLVMGVLFIVFGSPAMTATLQEWLQKGIEAGTASTDASSVEQAVMIMQVCFMSTGVMFVCMTGIAVAGGILSLKAFKEEQPRLPLLVANVVFGVMINTITLVGAIFGLIVDGKEQRRAQVK